MNTSTALQLIMGFVFDAGCRRAFVTNAGNKISVDCGTHILSIHAPTGDVSSPGALIAYVDKQVVARLPIPVPAAAAGLLEFPASWGEREIPEFVRAVVAEHYR